MEWLADLSAAMLLFSLLMYLMLDGTDLGAGMLLIFFNDEKQKRSIVKSMLPIWDANETWLVLLAGGLFALFPAAYARLFSALYIPVFVMLLSLILRALALEYRETVSGRIRTWLDKLLPASSALAAYCQGICAGLVVSGNIAAGAYSWLGLYPMLSGIGLICAYMLLGCGWIRWRVAEKKEKRTLRLTRYFLLLSLGLFLIIQCMNPAPWQQVWQLAWGKGLILLIVLLWLFSLLALQKLSPFRQLAVTLILLAAIVIQTGIGIYPELIPGEVNLHRVASGGITQAFLLTGIAFIIPITLLYHSWAFWVFRGKIEK
ncbi:cytochrome d ubiquinol oxidase subunit II (plasmid) [Rahnella aquatilis]|nr:cytochrome d ubiquinol oxidase subunit II [Rahnella aquatilis]